MYKGAILVSLLFVMKNFQQSIELFSAENVFFRGISADYPIFAIIFGRFAGKCYLCKSNISLFIITMGIFDFFKKRNDTASYRSGKGANENLQDYDKGYTEGYENYYDSHDFQNRAYQQGYIDGNEEFYDDADSEDYAEEYEQEYDEEYICEEFGGYIEDEGSLYNDYYDYYDE